MTTCLNLGVIRLPISPTLLSVLRIDAPPGDDGRSAADGDRLPPSMLFVGLVEDISLNNDAGSCSFDFVFCRVDGPVSLPGVVAGIGR